MSAYKTSIEIDGVEDVPVVVEYIGVEASGDGWNEPAVPAHIEIESVRTANGNEVELTTQQERRMEQEINEWLNDEN